LPCGDILWLAAVDTWVITATVKLIRQPQAHEPLWWLWLSDH